MKHRGEQGFTLVEVIMSTLILIIGMGIVAAVIANITSKNFYSQRHTQAVLLAQTKIEDLLNDGYSHQNLLEGHYENPWNPVTSTGDSSGIFYQSWDIEDVQPIPRSKQITSIVEWEGNDGERKSVSLTAVCIDQSN